MEHFKKTTGIGVPKPLAVARKYVATEGIQFLEAIPKPHFAGKAVFKMASNYALQIPNSRSESVMTGIEESAATSHMHR